MVIFLIFMTLTGLVIFITWYIVTNDTRRINARKAKKLRGTTKPPKDDNKRNIKNIWGVEDIRDGIFYLKNNTYAAVVKMGSVDVELLSEEEQSALEEALIRLTLGLNFPVRLYSTTDYVDTSGTQLAIRKALMDGNFSSKLRTYAENILQYLEDMGKNRSVYMRRDYFVVFYEGSLEKAYTELDRRCQQVIASLSGMKLSPERINSDEALNVLHNALNKRSSIKPSDIVKKGGFEFYVAGSGKILEDENEKIEEEQKQYEAVQ